uniref:Reverse transcriptase domain-containing protein n=1 Tax=Cannabis sativa TaxID=3483 RepID=A0A803QGM3_CANSA
MVQTPVLSSRRLFFSRYSSLWFFSIFAYLYVLSLTLFIPLSSPAKNPVSFFFPTLMASSSSNPNPITALDDEHSLVHDFDHISIHSSTDADSFCLFFKLLSPKSAKPSWIEKAMSEAWTLRFPCQISEYHSGLFLASFQCDGDRRRILEEQPWHFDKFLMIQVHRIPFGRKSPQLAQFIADDIGDLLEIYPLSLMENFGPYLRIRVLLDITKPLRRGMTIRFRGISKPRWVSFKYESLPNFCYFCGLVDHTYNKCSKYLLRCDNFPHPPLLEYKDILRATPSSPHKKNPFQLSNSTPFEEFFPRTHPTSDAQDLQQAVDQFLHVDSPQSSPNPRISTQSPQPASPFSSSPATQITSGHAIPSFSVRFSAPIITDSVSISTHTDKGKGKAPMISPPTNPPPSRGDKGLVINDSCPPPIAATSLLLGRPSCVMLHKLEVLCAACLSVLEPLPQMMLWSPPCLMMNQRRVLLRGPAENNESLQLECSRLSTHQVAFLAEPYTEAEVKHALFSLSADKAPGPDGLNSLFYKSNWSTLGTDFTKAMLQILNHQGDISPINQTIIVLIPKKKNPKHVCDFRPISLCNTFYKCLSKVIANRLRLVLHSIISINQSAFLKGRQITDNILLANEIIHAIHSRRSRKVGWAAIKLDMEKAFDRVEWPFLNRLLAHVGFPSSFSSLIMRCLSTVQFRLSINGSLTDTFHSTRGIRQGDPLSPYLFLLIAEGLSAAIRLQETNAHFSGIQICRGAQPLSHLLFADDSMVFTPVHSRASDSLNVILDLYNKATGQLVNRDKSSILFSPNTFADAQLQFRQSLHLHGEGFISKYLGVPHCVGRGTKKVHWKNWNVISVSKFFGGMGFRILSSHNQALLAKQAWRIWNDRNSLLHSVLKARYFKHSDFMNAPTGHNSSFTWRSILWGRQLLQKGLVWKIGTGVNVPLSAPNWIPNIQRPILLHPLDQSQAFVSSFINHDSTWNVHKLQHFFPSYQVEHILKIPIDPTSTDSLIWGFHPSGIITVKSAYHLASSLASVDVPSSSNPNPYLHWWKTLCAAQCKHQDDNLHSEASRIPPASIQQLPPSLSLETPSLFVDAAIDHQNGITVTGFIFKHGFQTVLASHYHQLPGAVSPIFAEGQALLQSLKWCIDSQFSPQIVFSDCLNLVSKVNGSWQDNSALSGLVSRIRLLFSTFPGASLQFLPRQFNMGAHVLAREALRSREVS